MTQKTYSSAGFVIKRTSYREGDRIITLFTKELGKITVLAKGVKKLTSRKRGGVEIFNLIKFSAVKSHTFDILTEVEVLKSYEPLRKSLKKVSVAYYFCEVINKLTQEGQKHESLFFIMEDYFASLESSKNLRALRLSFVAESLISLGFWPEGKKMDNPDLVLETVTERKINSISIGRKMLQRG